MPLHPSPAPALRPFVLFAGLVALAPAQATLTGYATQAAYAAATAANIQVQTVDFESVVAGTTFASGSGTGGLRFVYSIAGEVMKVGNRFPTTSPARYLGLNNGNDAFYLGDGFSIDFGRNVSSVGLYIIAGSGVQAGDFTIATPFGSVASGAVADLTLSDGSKAYYLGLQESEPARFFSSVSFASVSGPLVVFNVDDITSSIPEPGAWALWLTGWVGISWLVRRRAA